MPLSNTQLSADTQAALLLCGHLDQENSGELKPLTTSEYAKLTKWLIKANLRPSDLLETAGIGRLHQAEDEVPDVERIARLLDRGGLLAIQLEAWTNKGLWVLGRSDDEYPSFWKKRLVHRSPPIMYGVGNRKLLNMGGLAIVGSRKASDTAIGLTQMIAERCVQDGIAVISGGARGIDQASMLSALNVEGSAVGVLADSLARASVSSQYRKALRNETLVLVSPYAPHAGFSVGNAMGRNKLIYTLADWALVVESTANKGGTWTGATENLNNGWVPLFVRAGEDVATGNTSLIQRGAIPLNAAEMGNKDISLPDLFIQRQQDHQATQVPAAPASVSTRESTIVGVHFPITPRAKVDSSAEKPSAEMFWQDAIWPVIQHLVAQAGIIDKKSLAKTLDVRQVQADDWLKRAAREGRLHKQTRPAGYTMPENHQLSLGLD